MLVYLISTHCKKDFANRVKDAEAKGHKVLSSGVNMREEYPFKCYWAIMRKESAACSNQH